MLSFDVPRYLVGRSVRAGAGGHPALAVYCHHADGVVRLSAGPGGGAGPCGRRGRLPVPAVGAAALRRTRLHVLVAKRAAWLGVTGIGAGIKKFICVSAIILRFTFLTAGYPVFMHAKNLLSQQYSGLSFGNIS